MKKERKKFKPLNSCRKFLISFNVCRLFTNIQLLETIDLAINWILDKGKLSVEREDLRKLLFVTMSFSSDEATAAFHDSREKDLEEKPRSL